MKVGRHYLIISKLRTRAFGAYIQVESWNNCDVKRLSETKREDAASQISPEARERRILKWINTNANQKREPNKSLLDFSPNQFFYAMSS